VQKLRSTPGQAEPTAQFFFKNSTTASSDLHGIREKLPNTLSPKFVFHFRNVFSWLHGTQYIEPLVSLPSSVPQGI
jgi:hypothetical protein